MRRSRKEGRRKRMGERFKYSIYNKKYKNQVNVRIFEIMCINCDMKIQ
jgi:hypothetical protein